MRVIYWTELFWPHIGGVEVLSRQLIAALQKGGHEVTVLTSQSDHASAPEEMVQGIQVHRLPFQSVIARRDLEPVHKLAKQVTALLQRIQPDLVHINSSQPSIFIFHLARTGPSIPTLFTLHEPPVQAQGPNSLVGRTLRAADWVAAVSQATLSQARQLVPEIAPRSSVILNGLEMPTLPAAPLPFDAPSLLCIGRIIGDKGFDLAIQALSEIRGMFPSAHMVIAGDGRDRRKLELQAEALGLKDSVEFMGWCQPESIPALINAATIVLVPSRWQEPFGLVALQAAQMARPVIASRTGGLPEVVAQNETGLLFEKNDASELARQVVYLLQHPEFAVRMGHAARHRARELFSLERTAAEYDNLYRRLGGQAGSIPASAGGV